MELMEGPQPGLGHPLLPIPVCPGAGPGAMSSGSGPCPAVRAHTSTPGHHHPSPVPPSNPQPGWHHNPRRGLRTTGDWIQTARISAFEVGASPAEHSRAATPWNVLRSGRGNAESPVMSERRHLATEEQNRGGQTERGNAGSRGSQERPVPRQQSHGPSGPAPCVLPITPTHHRGGTGQAPRWGSVHLGLPGTTGRGREGALRSKQKELRGPLGCCHLCQEREEGEGNQPLLPQVWAAGMWSERGWGGGQGAPTPTSYRSLEFSPGRKGPPSREWKQSLASGPRGVRGLKQSGIIILSASLPYPQLPTTPVRGEGKPRQGEALSTPNT